MLPQEEPHAVVRVVQEGGVLKELLQCLYLAGGVLPWEAHRV